MLKIITMVLIGFSIIIILNQVINKSFSAILLMCIILGFGLIITAMHFISYLCHF